MHARPARLSWSGGVVSFTFDDFPKSALISGGSILERYGVRATYYASMGLAGTRVSVGRIFDPEDICAAHHGGHEIACHTHTHLDCCASAKRSILSAVRHNAIAFSSIIEGFVPTNFAYPYGSVSPTAKRVLGSRFSSCRGIGEDINHGVIDLADLLAISIYSSTFDETKMRRLIDRARSLGGWLIFYTHDVGEVPLPYGCKPAQLEAVVAYASKCTTILPVRDVVRHLRPLEAVSRTVYNAIPRKIYKRLSALNGSSLARNNPLDPHLG
jgi:peptidoglycan/xylan/chitin deacetylase (PgdA/CDA1 family)